MKVAVLQILLIVLVLGLAWRLLLSTGQRTQAVRRLALMVFAVLAAASILFPALWTRLAHLVGVGRGTDLILYGLVVAFLSFVVTTYRRMRQFEARYTRLARRIALDEAAMKQAGTDPGGAPPVLPPPPAT